MKSCNYNNTLYMPVTNSKFITFEGGEGAGKSTQVKMLSQAFAKAGRKVMATREPGGTDGAEAIRALLVNGAVNKWTAETELLLHLAARCDHINQSIKPCLTSGIDVICDRFTDSTIAYQAYGHGLGAAFVEQMCNLVVGTFQPDLTIILDIAGESGIKRAENRSTAETRYERMGASFHGNVRSGFLEIAKKNPQRCVVISAENDIESVYNQVITTIIGRLGITL